MLRPLLREPGRALLILFAIALGDAAVVAIDLAGGAAAGSFHSSIETLTGKNDFEVTAAGGLPESIVSRLETLPFELRVSPRIEDHANVVATGETVPLIGIDMVGEANGESAAKSSNGNTNEILRHINDPDAIAVTPGFGKNVGDKIALLINDQKRDYVVRAVITDSRRGSGDAVLMDIHAAQLATGKLGRIDRVLIKTPHSNDTPNDDVHDFNNWQQRLKQALPAGVVVNAQGSKTFANRRMLAAFRWNLRILSYIALLVGAFLIYNALSVSVVRRRADIGTMRALGASSGAVLMAFLFEAVAFGTAGSLAALPLGRILAAGAVRMLSTTVNSLYVSSRPGSMTISAATVALAFTVGIGISIVSAMAPAREAGHVPPIVAMARGQREYEVRVQRKRDAVIALVLAALGAVAVQAPAIGGMPVMGYVAALLFVASAALFTPLAVHLATLAASSTLRRILGVEALLASRSLGGSLRRTSVLVGALATAVAMMTSVGIMVGSFRQTVLTWMDNELPADIYVRPAGAVGGDQHPTIAPEVAERIGKVPTVEYVSRFRAYVIDYDGLPATLASAEPNFKRTQQSLSLVSGRSAENVLRELSTGDNAIISEPFANKHRVKANDTIDLPLGERKVRFRVLDVFFDYGNEAGLILLDRTTMLRYLPDPAPTNLAVYLVPGTNFEQARIAIQQAAAGSDVLLFSNRELRREGIRVFDQTFAITYALEAISILVAIGGIAGALISIVMDRRREFGVLRFLGATSTQIRKMIMVEAGLIGIMANAVGLALGYVLSLVLVYVINKQSFGWTIQFHWPVEVLMGSLTVVYAATVLAALYPARLAVRLDPIEVVHEE